MAKAGGAGRVRIRLGRVQLVIQATQHPVSVLWAGGGRRGYWVVREAYR